GKARRGARFGLGPIQCGLRRLPLGLVLVVLLPWDHLAGEQAPGAVELLLRQFQFTLAPRDLGRDFSRRLPVLSEFRLAFCQLGLLLAGIHPGEDLPPSTRSPSRARISLIRPPYLAATST